MAGSTGSALGRRSYPLPYTGGAGRRAEEVVNLARKGQHLVADQQRSLAHR